MDFARKQLEKYGWTDGKGLGKNENGISQPLKPKLKRSVTGIGHDAAKDFTEHWWTQLYNKAAENVQVEEEKGKTKKIKTKQDNFKITNSTYHIQNQNGLNDKEAYGDFFIRTAVMASDGTGMDRVREESESEGEKETKDVFKMTDEELFAACEGRTAHKGARHGLKALGKLARIERQEQALLNQDKYQGYSHSKKKNETITDLQVEDMNLNSDSSENVKTKKKKKRKCKEFVCDDVLLEKAEDALDNSSVNQSKTAEKTNKKKFKNYPQDEDMAECNESVTPLPEIETCIKKVDSDASNQKISRKSKKSKRKIEEETIEESVCDSEVTEVQKKTKRKKKSKEEES